MPSTYSTNLGFELPALGEQSGTWGTTVNTNVGTLIEQSISGYVTQAITDGPDTTITIPNGSTGVARNMYLELTGALTGARTLLVPANKKLYFIYNNTTGGHAVTVKVSGQTGISVPNGKKIVLVCNGTDIFVADNYIVGDVTGNAGTVTNGVYTSGSYSNPGWITALAATKVTGQVAVANGGTGAADAATARTNLGVPSTTGTGASGSWGISITGNAATATSAGSLTGTVAVANGGTGATDAGTARTNLGLGSLATLSTVNDGNWSGTDLAVLNGGTGASDAATARTNLDVPSRSGSGASGSWGISVTGSSASCSGNAANVTGTVAVANGGTGATTAANARVALLPSYTNNASKVLALNSGATDVEWTAVAPGGVTSVTAGSPLASSGGTTPNITFTGTLGVANGGTGGSDTATARTNLDVPSRGGSGASGTWGISITGNSASSASCSGNAVNVTGTVGVGNGGTGATDAATARTNLGVPSTTGSGASGSWGISITGSAASASTATTAGNVSGTVAIGNGGTGSTSASGARTNLGLTIGSDVLAPSGNGGSLTNLNASNISSGTLGSSYLPGVAIRNVSSGQTSGSLYVQNYAPTTEGSNGDVWLKY